MTKKTLTIKLKGITIRLEGLVFLHCDLIEQLHNRLINDGFIVDIDTLFNNIITKG